MVSPHSRQWESISNIYIKQIVALASEPVGGRSRATELPCFHAEPPDFLSLFDPRDNANMKEIYTGINILMKYFVHYDHHNGHLIFLAN